MKHRSRTPGSSRPARTRRPKHAALRALAVCASLAPAGCQNAPKTPTHAPERAALTADERRAAALITAASMAAPIRFLADDALEGRGPGSRGGELATKYIASQFEQLGLAPGAADGTYYQKVPLVVITPQMPPSVAFQGASGALSLAVPNDLVIRASMQQERVEVAPSEIVFVGYGMVAPEYEWDDYKDVDVRGKIVLVMNNDPEGDPKLFGGKTRLWYGRWDYKYHQAALKGARAAILIHTTPSAGYPWQVVSASNHRERSALPSAGEPTLQAEMWATEDASRKLSALGGHDLDELRRRAERRDFRPQPLGVAGGFSYESRLRRVESANVLGVLRGGDPKLASEAVVYTAHHDHLGIGPPKGGDAIYNGALDNAAGVGAMLSIARAATLSPRPRRSILFMSVAAEEQGLLGSAWYASHPTFAPGRIAADLNIDTINVDGRTCDVGYVGYGKSTLDDIVTPIARAQGRSVHGDAFPDRGAFYRSDQFNFAKIGVPSIYLSGGPCYVGRPPGWGEERAEFYERTHYHQPSDEFDPKWNWDGAIEDAQLLLLSGLRIANQDGLPAWRPGDEFARVPRAR